MKRLLAVLVAVVPLAVFAQADKKPAAEKKPAGAGMQAEKKPEAGAAASGQGMDMSKMGPSARKPKNEAQTRKEIQAFLKEEDAIMKKGDFNASLARHDFPLYMVTDDMNGVPEAKLYTREEYTQTMKPFWDNMPKDTKTTHRHNITVLSDSLASVTDDFTMTMGKQKMTGKNHTLLVKRDGQWKWKVMTEAGWGGQPGTGGAPSEPGKPGGGQKK